uniref:Uncharacterized protein n=2 Tax=Timema TaxID=61471 RepID=A0A7R9ICL0_9NEOP|nr:unnamed protein product [Timema bartmani]CAD7455794.1 unnamed protein product [Timema tahoe]
MGPTLKHTARYTIGLPLLFILLLLLLEGTTATDEGGDVSNDADKQLKVNLEFDEIELDDLSENKAKAEYDYFVSGGAETLEKKWSEFLAKNRVVPGSIFVASRFSEKAVSLERGQAQRHEYKCVAT